MSKKVLNAAQVMKIKNSFAADEKAQAAADALIEAIQAMGEDENEHNVDELVAKVNEILEALKTVPEPVQEFVHNSIEARMKVVTNIAGKKEISNKVKKAVIEAVMEYNGKEGKMLQERVNGIFKENGVTGLTFGDVIDYTLVDKFGKEDALYSQFTQTKVSRFFYSTNDMSTAAAIAKQWDKSSVAAKDIEAIEATPKTISTAYVYKRQQVAQEDLDDIRTAGDEAGFIGYITEELERVLVNTIVMAVLVGDAVNASGKRLTNFESIATKNATDAFTLVSTAAATGDPLVSEVRAAADLIRNPKGDKKVAIMHASTKTKLAGYVYASGGDTYFRSDEELAGQLGVDEIYTTDLMSGKGVIVMVPAEYWVLEKNAISVAYPTWEHNVLNWQAERNIGGKIHGLLSTAIIKPHA